MTLGFAMNSSKKWGTMQFHGPWDKHSSVNYPQVSMEAGLNEEQEMTDTSLLCFLSIIMPLLL
jgi:hypothetical protein